LSQSQSLLVLSEHIRRGHWTPGCSSSPPARYCCRRDHPDLPMVLPVIASGRPATAALMDRG